MTCQCGQYELPWSYNEPVTLVTGDGSKHSQLVCYVQLTRRRVPGLAPFAGREPPVF